MIYYQVNNKQIFNWYLAQFESYKTGLPVTFHCYDQENDALGDWSREPPQTLDQLMTQHAHNLRNKYQRLVLHWSGGTDSHTIYNIFAQNRIHLDEIIIKYGDKVPGQPYSHVTWMKTNHWDPTTIITSYSEDDPEVREPEIQNDEWLFQNRGGSARFPIHGQICEYSTRICEQHHGAYTWAAIVGLEKPIVGFRDGTWWTKQSDHNGLKIAMGQQHQECFFLDPVINCKQSHMAKNMLKQLQRQDKNLEVRTRFYTRSSPGYTAWARAVGRHPELSQGVSFAQKINGSHVTETQLDVSKSVFDFDAVRSEKSVIDALKSQNPIVTNYVRGWHNLASERGFYEYLNQTAFEKPNHIFLSRTLHAKSYNLGP